MKKYYDEFTKLTVEKMSQAITDMTYSFEKTIVPKEHYKKVLNKELMEVMSSDVNIEMNLLKPYYDMINEMITENSKFFFKALLLIDSKTKYNSLSATNIEALNCCWDMYSSDKKSSIVNNSILELYKDISENGIMDLLDENKEIESSKYN